MENETMKCLPELDRPYERAETYGVKTLTDSELLAVIIKAGTKNKTAVGVARSLITHYGGSLEEICNASLADLQRFEGIGRVKAIQLQAVGELSSRIHRGGMRRKVSADDIDALGFLLVQQFGKLPQETFKICMLDSKLRLMKIQEIAVGTMDRAIVNPRDVFRYAVREACARIVLVHNHPSGDVLPSRKDIGTTKLLIEAGQILGIAVHDHIIVGAEEFFSMRRSGDIKELELACGRIKKG